MLNGKINKLATPLGGVLTVTYCSVSFAATVQMETAPLAGVTLSYPPNLTLALSVEYPTAGGAYTRGQRNRRAGPQNHDAPLFETEDLKHYYRGYFDNRKCYRYTYSTNVASLPVGDIDSYNHDGYFYPVAAAVEDSGYVGLCDDPDTFSGNLMNWLTMSAIDIFRQTTTGGNRAFGVGNDQNAYSRGDTPTETYLRRATVFEGSNNHDENQNRWPGYNINFRAVELPEHLFDRVLPHAYRQIFLNDPEPNIWRHLINNGTCGSGNNACFSTSSMQPNQIFFLNRGFTTQPVRVDTHPGYWSYFLYHKPQTSSNRQHDDNKYFQRMPVVVKVCDSSSAITSEENCIDYNGVGKPEGLLQKTSRDEGARIAVLGYPNIPLGAADTLSDIGSYNGGVLRARMKSLHDGAGQEWQNTTGQLIVNPDTADAAASGVPNSGVINYINKFGDTGIYRSHDPAAELYYTAMSYLRNTGAVYNNKPWNNVNKDGFPIITNWEDPLKVGDTPQEELIAARCRPNNILYIGDTYTNWDQNLPNFSEPGPTGPLHNVVQTRSYVEEVLRLEGKPTYKWNANLGARPSPGGMFGLSYWAYINDVRPDIPGDQNISNFMIDVVERDELMNSRTVGELGDFNVFWASAKYGGFRKNGSYTFGTPLTREQWTDDAVGSSSIPGIPMGIPRNFAIANDPDAMVNALERALDSTRYQDPSQSLTGLTIPNSSSLTLDGTETVLNAVFDLTSLVGDLVVNTIGFDANNQLALTEQWRASSSLNASYHNPTGWQNRNAFTTINGTVRSFSDAAVAAHLTGAGSDAASLQEYILGNSAQEGSQWRNRTSLLGTMIHSNPISILPASASLNGCTYSNPAATSRPVHYAVAANDGFLHIFNATTRNEVLAYMPSTALGQLHAQSLSGSQHAFLNDGSAIYTEQCFGTQARSLLIGSAGRGGASVYALDVTDLSTPGANNILWEFSESDDAGLGLTVPPATLAKSGAGNPIAIVSSGYNNQDGRGSLFILNVDKPVGQNWQQNVNYRKIFLGTAGVGSAFVYDKDADDVPDSIYVGDFDGNLWRVDYDAAGDQWSVAYGGNPMFSGTHPITGSPFAEVVDNNLYVVFGTGQYLNSNGTTATTQNYAYGLIDQGANSSTIRDIDLLLQTIDTVVNTFVDPPRTLWKISENTMGATHRGWRLRLNPGQAIASDALIRGGRVAEFVAVSRSGTVGAASCAVEGSTSIISIDVKSGGEYGETLFDTNGDGKVDNDDEKGGMLEVHGVIAAGLTGSKVRRNGNDTYDRFGADTLVGNILHVVARDWAKTISGGSVLIRTSLREVPL